MANMGTTGTINITKDMMDKQLLLLIHIRQPLQILIRNCSQKLMELFLHPFLVQQLLDLRHFILRILNLIRVKILTKMLKSLKTICETVKKQIPGDTEGVDDKLGTGNTNAGKSEANK